MYDCFTWDRNRGIADPQRRIPAATTVSRGECLERFPGLSPAQLTGGVLFSDARMHNPARLGLAFLRAAMQSGARAANYLQAQSVLQKDGRIIGVQARDLLGETDLQVRGKVVINAAGPWAPWLLHQQLGIQLTPPAAFSRDVCMFVSRHVSDDWALAVSGHSKDPDALVSRSKRHLFIVPCDDYTMIGVWHKVYEGEPRDCRIEEPEMVQFLGEINDAYPDLALTTTDVSFASSGLTLFGQNKPQTENLSYGKRSRVVDHQAVHGIRGLISLIGVRYTTARAVAVRVVEMARKKLGRRLTRSNTATTPVFGGDIESISNLLESAHRDRPTDVDKDIITRIVRNHGSAYPRVLAYLKENPHWSARLGNSRVIKAEVIYAIREEMAKRLSDVAFRRTDLVNDRDCDGTALRECVELMAKELDWDESKQRHELDAFERIFRNRHADSYEPLCCVE